MAQWNSKSVSAPLVGLAMAAFLGPLSFTRQAAGVLTDSLESAIVLELRTDQLATSLVIAGDPLNRSVTSLEIQGELVGDSDGKGTITLDESVFTFNEFGDATEAQHKAAVLSQIILRRMNERDAKVTRQPPYRKDKDEKRRLYEIVFAVGAFAHRMFLVLDGSVDPHRLIIQGGDMPVASEHSYTAHILNLHGLPTIQESLPDFPLRTRINLETLSSAHHSRAADGRLRGIAVCGILNGSADLYLDPNNKTFNGFGDVVGTQLWDYFPLKVSRKHVQIPDPAGKGRLLFEFVPSGKAMYFLALSPTEAGPHRLLIREGDTLQHVLPLHNPDRRNQLMSQPQLASTSSAEQQAVGELRKAFGYTFRFKVESGVITKIHIEDGDNAGLECLKGLTKLQNLSLSGSSITDAGLKHLRGLANLKCVELTATRVTPAGEAALKSKQPMMVFMR